MCRNLSYDLSFFVSVFKKRMYIFFDANRRENTISCKLLHFRVCLQGQHQMSWQDRLFAQSLRLSTCPVQYFRTQIFRHRSHKNSSSGSDAVFFIIELFHSFPCLRYTQSKSRSFRLGRPLLSCFCFLFCFDS